MKNMTAINQRNKKDCPVVYQRSTNPIVCRESPVGLVDQTKFFAGSIAAYLSWRRVGRASIDVDARVSDPESSISKVSAFRGNYKQNRHVCQTRRIHASNSEG